MEKHDTQFSTLAPLLAIGMIIMLSILVYRSYQHTALLSPTIILPGGVTYLGK